MAITPACRCADRSDRSARSDRAAIRAHRSKSWRRTPIERADPIGDHAHSPVAGIVHRYPDRVLFKLVHVCAVYCRFCFRREMVGPGKDTALSDEAYAAALDYIRTHREIWEVILTGGDPLMLSARRLRAIMRDLAAIPHVKIIRIHTRIPVADPARVTDCACRGAEGQGRDHLGRRACQSSTRIDVRRPARRAKSSPTPAFRWSASRCCCRASMTMRRRWRP